MILDSLLPEIDRLVKGRTHAIKWKFSLLLIKGTWHVCVREVEEVRLTQRIHSS